MLITHVAGTDKRKVYHPPVPRTVPSYYRRYGMYYPTVYGYVHDPGYFTTHQYVLLESNLYAVGSEKLVWSATTETADPRSIEKVVGELNAVLVKQMKKDGLVGQ